MAKDCDVLILGAGPAGLTAGYKLAEAGASICIVDKQEHVGGLAKTLRHGDCLLDIGPHILCSREYVYDFNPEMYAFIKTLLHDDMYEYESEHRKYLESMQVDQVRYKYPVSILNALKNAGLGKSIHIGWDYVRAKSSKKTDGDDYESSLVSSLGQSLAGLFLLNIGEKTWGVSCSAMSQDVAWRVGEFSILDVFKKQFSTMIASLQKRGDPVNYPKHGIGDICDRLKQEIDAKNVCDWFLSATPRNISVENGSVVSVDVVCSDGNVETIYPKHLISSIPMPYLLSSMRPFPPEDVLAAGQSLRCRCHICVYLVFSVDSILKEHCIYFADPKIPFSRMMEQKHYSDMMISDGKTVLAIEYFSWIEDGIWSMKDQELYDLTVEWLKRLSIIQNQEIIDYFVNRETDAYPAYELGYRQHLEKVMSYLDGITNLDVIGRAGSFTYIGQYKAMQMGWDAAEHMNTVITTKEIYDNTHHNSVSLENL
ncbi:MAG: NAD(P)-binding protein [Candidatus Cloacimonetes bacterium]|nr:NAD(P)-binding protein [Candidatus Cloacimonadota bacterium]